MKARLLFFFSCLCLSFAHAQTAAPADTLDIARLTEFAYISDNTSIYVDSGKHLSAADVLDKPFMPLMKFKYRRQIPARMIAYTFFLKIPFYNSTDSAREFFLLPGTFFQHTSLYKTGTRLEPVTDKHEPDGFSKFTLGPGERTTLIVKLDPVKYESVLFNVLLVDGPFLDSFKSINQGNRMDMKTFGYVLSGVLLMMILFMGANYILSRKKEFLFNALYSTCMFALIYLSSVLLRTYSPFTNFFMSYFDFFLLLTGTIFYISFTRHFLNTPTRYQSLDRILKYFNGFLMLMLVLYSGLHFFTPYFWLQYLLENIVKFMSLGLGVFFIVMAIRQHDRLLNYLAVGNAALVLFSGISLGIIWGDIRYGSIYKSSLFYYYIGIVLELVFFLLGLTYKNRQELIERTKEQEALKLYAEKKEFEAQLSIMKAQQEERNRISADMHDDLGAGVTTIRLYSELARQKLGDQLIPEIDKISSASDELLTKMNAIIWSMTSSNDSLGNTIAYIRSYALEFLEDTGIDCRINLPDKLPEIEVPGVIRRNVFLVMKEALHNVLKHAKATEVKITLERQGDGLTLYIHDNGIGINPDKLRQFGNGLKNMRKRMQDIHAEFSIENRNGTLITLHRLVRQFADPGIKPKKA